MKKTELKSMIRNIVKEEVRLSMRKLLKEFMFKEISDRSLKNNNIKKSKSKHNIKNNTFSSNKLLNEALNDTAQTSQEWKTLGDGTFTTDSMNTILQNQYSTDVEVSGKQMVASMGVDPDNVPEYLVNVFEKDYRGFMKKVNGKTNN